LKESIGGVAYTPGEKTEHELKSALQKVVENECGHLLATYGFQIKRVLSVVSSINNSYNFAVEIYSNGLQKSLTVQQSMSRMDLYHYGFKGDLSPQSAVMFSHVFQRMARDLQHEIEKLTKDMPVANQMNPYIYSDSISGLTINSLSFTSNEIRQKQMIDKQMMDSALFNAGPFNAVPSEPKKPKTKYPYIDALISDSKKRLFEGHANPKSAFEYF